MSTLLQCFLLLAINAVQVVLALNDDEAMRERLEAKPWYLRDTQIGSTTIPITPVTLVIGLLAFMNLMRVFRGPPKSWAEASHILITGDEHAEQQLKDIRDSEIQNNATKFAKCAKQHSACPSKTNGGNLGRFKQGEMAPPFDRAVFDPNNPLEKTIGPIETQFGWHLIYIHKRQINN
jgi:peptidyl-prolyl cis-trans isomerase C